MSRHEKSKSVGGGILESWFGRPSKSKGNSTYNTNSLPHGAAGRPAYTDTEGGFGVDDLERHIQELSDAQVNAKFLEILEDMNIPKDKREPLLSKTREERQQMIFMHMKKGKRRVRKGQNQLVDKIMHYARCLHCANFFIGICHSIITWYCLYSSTAFLGPLFASDASCRIFS